MPSFPKALLLKCYDAVLPRASRARFWLYNKILWKIFTDPIDRKLHEYGRHKKRVKFIQIGACDGIYADNYFKFIRNKSWEGILIEPMPAVFDQLVKNYGRVRKEGLIFLNCAVCSRRGSRELYYVDGVNEGHRDHKPLMALSSFYREHLLKFDEWTRQRPIASVKVDCVPLLDIVGKYGYQDVDVLLIDVEGYDFEIIKTVDFSMLSPDVIVYENQHLSQADQKACEQLLRDHSYHILVDGDDTLAWK